MEVPVPTKEEYTYQVGNNSDIDIMILVELPETEIKKIENDIYDVAFEILRHMSLVFISERS